MTSSDVSFLPRVGLLVYSKMETFTTSETFFKIHFFLSRFQGLPHCYPISVSQLCLARSKKKKRKKKQTFFIDMYCYE